MDLRGRPGQSFGGDSSLRFHMASYLFCPVETTTQFKDGADEDSGYQSAAEPNLLPHFPVVAAVGSKSPSSSGVLESTV